VDSTGFGTQCFYRHYSAKYGREQNTRDFLKLHAMVGTKTNVVTAAHIGDRNSSDTLLLPKLTIATAEHFNVQEVTADKGYSSVHNVATVTSIGAAPYVAFTANAKGNNKSPLWNKLFHYFQMNRDEFMTHYHTRSNVES